MIFFDIFILFKLFYDYNVILKYNPLNLSIECFVNIF